MKERWHELIQRCVDETSSADEIAELQEALGSGAELRALYLDYLNLDAALSVIADAAATAANGAAGPTAQPQPNVRPAAHWWGWVAGTAACAALVMLATHSKRLDVSRAQPDLAAATASAHAAIARLPAGVPPVLPAWMSPTASLLDQPAIPN